MLVNESFELFVYFICFCLFYLKVYQLLGCVLGVGDGDQKDVVCVVLFILFINYKYSCLFICLSVVLGLRQGLGVLRKL